MTSNDNINQVLKISGIIEFLNRFKISIQPSVIELVSKTNETIEQLLPVINTASKLSNSCMEALVPALLAISNSLGQASLDSIQQALKQFAEIAESYDLNSLEILEESLSEEFIQSSNLFLDEVTAESAIPPEVCNDTISSIKTLVEKRKMTFVIIYHIIILLVTFWTVVKDYLPDQQITHMESMLQETIEIGNELIEMQRQELEIEIQQKEIQSQQIEESKKQTRLLEKLVKNQNDSPE